MSSFSKEWEDVYRKELQLTSWPWSSLVSLVCRYCKDSIISNGVVFELGCGYGPNIPFIQSLGMDYYGVEGSATVVSKLHQKYKELKDKVVVGDFTNIKCFDNVPDIDIIIDRAAVTHNNFSDIKFTLKNSYDALKNGGYFIGIDWFSTKHSDSILGKQSEDRFTRTDIEMGQFKDVGRVHFSDEKHLRSLFSDFDIISLNERVIKSYEPLNNHQFASWNIVAKKR